MQPFQCDLQPQIQHTNRTTHTGTTTRCRTQRRHIRDRNDPSRTRRTHEVPFIAGCNHFTRNKNTRFHAPASSRKQSPGNIHAAITIRFAVSCSKPASLYTRGNTRWQQSSSHSNAICNHRFKKRIYAHRHNHSLQNTEEEPIASGTTAAAHTRYLSSPAATTLHGKITRSAPGSSPRQSPGNIHASITLRFAASRIEPASLYTHGNTRWQQSSSHSNAISNNRFKKRRELRTQTQPLVAEHRGGPNASGATAAAPAAHTRYTFHRRLQPLYTEKHKVSCSGFLPNT